MSATAGSSQATKSKSQKREDPPTRTPSPSGTPPNEPDTSTTSTPPPQPPRMSINKKIPTLATKLDGPATYPPWARSLEKYLDIIEIPDSEFRVWEVVTGGYPKPVAIVEAAPTAAGAEKQKQIRIWKDADAVALLTIEKNCTEDIQARIGNCETAASAYQELKKAFEGKTTTEFGALLDSFVSIQFDDRKTSVTEHIAHYERIWNTFAGIISRVELDTDDGFGKGLKNFAGRDKAKTEFLLRSFPAFYANTIENIKSKEPTYDDAVRKLKEYVPARQKGGKRKEAGTQEDPVVLKAEVKDNGKRCDYCIAKGWKGLNHTEKECYTKKREKAKAKKAKAKEEEEEGSENEGVTIKMIRIGKTKIGHEGLYEYDTAATHHTTNEYDRLVDCQHHLELPVQGHDGKESVCRVMGTLVFRHNGRNIRHEQCLYGPTYSNIISGLRMPDEFVHMICLPSKSTHLLQPLDVGCFGVLQTTYERNLSMWLRQNPLVVLSKPVFLEILEKTRKEVFTVSCVVGAWRKARCWPIDKTPPSNTNAANPLRITQIQHSVGSRKEQSKYLLRERFGGMVCVLIASQSVKFRLAQTAVHDNACEISGTFKSKGVSARSD